MRTDLPCLPLIQARFWNAVKDKEEYANYKYSPEFRMYMFPQMWGDTSLGFGGIGGRAITAAYTIVVMDDSTEWCGVFFGERLAYIILNPNGKFYEDLSRGQMESVSRKERYFRKEIKENT